MDTNKIKMNLPIILIYIACFLFLFLFSLTYYEEVVLNKCTAAALKRIIYIVFTVLFLYCRSCEVEIPVCLVISGLCDRLQLPTTMVGEWPVWHTKHSSVLHLSFLPMMVEISFVLWFPEKQSDSQLVSCLVYTNRHKRKKFQFYFYYLSADN